MVTLCWPILLINALPAQKSACKDLETKWPKTSHLVSRPLTLRLLTALARALKKQPGFPRAVPACRSL
ncbi:hypothetical protein BT102_05730 [Lacticaseibacillus rhamnosus]|nr:hypothetical protein BT102_05730 [Lacticaseibacillus rhamnosus]